MNPNIGLLSRREFNARYPLQIKRMQNQAKPKKRKPKASNKEAVREVFLDFATELADAEQKKDVVRVLVRVDEFVEKAIKAIRG